MIERLKSNAYNFRFGYTYFWRTHNGQEIDLIEEHNGKLSAFEFKWSEKKNIKPPKLWEKTYKGSLYKIINKNNYLDFLLT